MLSEAKHPIPLWCRVLRFVGNTSSVYTFCMSWYKSSLFLLAIVGWAEATESAHEAQGDRSMSAGRYGEAADHYQCAVDQNEKSAVLYRKLAEAHAKNEALPAAARAYEQAIALAPSHARTRTELAILFTRLDRYDDALALLEQTVREHPDRARAHMVLGLLHAREGRYLAAIAAYQRAIAAVPRYGEAWFNLGAAYLKQNDYAAAEQAFSSAIAADTTSAQFRNGLGRSYYLRRDYAAAATEFNRAVRLDSLFAQARFNLGNALLRSGQKEEGRRQLALYKRLDEEEERIAMLKNTLATHPDDAGTYHDLAVVYGQRGQYREARIRYLQALDRDPAFAPAHHNLGNIHFRRGEMAAAEQRFRRALQADSTYALAHLGLGNVQMLRKQYERAIASFRRGLRHQPDHPKLRRNLAAAEQIAAQASTTRLSSPKSRAQPRVGR
ncbi:MAG: tetratricopeptide repeat protein [Gemmatimonadetes bacterium]|nr:tetratricopeptide repeat protein [Gemmatimonadota bacterium]